jgi:hypothetical protein
MYLCIGLDWAQAQGIILSEPDECQRDVGVMVQYSH